MLQQMVDYAAHAPQAPEVDRLLLSSHAKVRSCLLMGVCQWGWCAGLGVVEALLGSRPK